MRVIAGEFRGRSLATPAGRTTRPITDRVKETLFNLLGHLFALPGSLPGFAVLDLFSGPGSMGIESLSRGAGGCTFVERDRRALKCLRQNIQTLGLERVSTVLADNAWTMRVVAPVGGFGVMFVDPPYRDADDPLRVVDLLERLAPGLADNGVLVFRQDVRSIPPPVGELPGLRQLDERRCGLMRLLLLEPVGR